MIKIAFNKQATGKADVSAYGMETAKKARAFHSSIPDYAPTPLRELGCLAESLGVGGIFVKDESQRFELNAFKVLGGSFAIGSHIASLMGEDIAAMPYERMCGDEVRKALGQQTFVTATDGNHGRGVAWTASKLGQKSVVHMPEGTASERLENIRRLGADANITDPTYDDCVRRAAKDAAENGWLLVQDTSWDGYERIPGLIMQGYTTMALEAVEQLGDKKPTHLFLQAGVGSMAAAVAAFMVNYYGEARPKIIIVEPHTADCHYLTAAADDGKLHLISGGMDSMMAGLCCGEPCPIAWEILKDYADAFASIPDSASAEAMWRLAWPVGTDPVTVSGESGAAGMGLALTLFKEENAELKKKLGIDENSVLLCFSTEGDTDKENYKKITGK
ncbi:MAG: diaminopropionate ammonia-lyase [Oscillospiraceae bacterium]|nr:diaminopropionate ammonia-lyase [Oscillospiraceae bacterium]